MKKRAAIYARVSTDENRQDPETQLRELRDFAERRGFEVVGEYIDHASGETEERASYKRLLEDVRRQRRLASRDFPALLGGEVSS